MEPPKPKKAQSDTPKRAAAFYNRSDFIEKMCREKYLKGQFHIPEALK